MHMKKTTVSVLLATVFRSNAPALERIPQYLLLISDTPHNLQPN